MGEAAVGFFLENLKNHVQYNAHLIKDLSKEIESLESGVEVFQGFMEDYDENPSSSSHEKALVNRILSIVNKAQDAIDDYVVEKAKQGRRNIGKTIIHSFDHVGALRTIAIEVQKIKADVERIDLTNPTGHSPHREDFNNTATTVMEGKAKQAPVVEEDEVIGFDKPAAEIMNFLRSSSLEVDVIGIVGMAGLGKTTLANKIYKDEKIDYEFIHRAWVYVSKDCRVEDVFISILKQLTDPSEDIYKMTSSELAQVVRKCLEKMKYLIVLDDVWNTQTWEVVRAALPNNKKGSRVVLTTRDNIVAAHANVNQNPYNLKFLSAKESSELLEKKVFGKEKCLPNLVGLLQRVAENCGGLPLAIVVIAGTLLPKRTVSDWWRQVADSVNEFIVKDERKFLEVVERSYKNLPRRLKLCFLYFGLIPRGHVDAWKLIELWIAEGFIKDDHRLGLEYAALTRLDELVDRNLVMATSTRSNDRIKTCRVHDTLRVFCREEADRQKLYQEVTMSNLGSLGNCRRICVDSNAAPYFSSIPSGEQLHTFLTFSEQKITLDNNQSKAIVKAFKRIRVLEASSLRFTRFPRELKELPLLRYLAFSCNFESIQSISMLSNLQTLVISTTKSALIFQQDIWKLYQLRNLKTNASAKLPTPPASDLIIGRENMQSLSFLDPGSCTKEIFSRTPKIKKLGVRGKLSPLLKDGSSTLIQNLEKLPELQNLKLFNDVSSNSQVWSLSKRFSEMLRNLSKLTLSGTSLGWKHMSTLGQLESLELLKLKEFAFKGDTWEEGYGVFPSLTFLCILRTDLKNWGAAAKQFPSLTRLVLKNCDKLLEVPSFLADSLSFQMLDIYCCNEEAVKSAKGIQKKKACGGLKLTVYPPGM